MKSSRLFKIGICSVVLSFNSFCAEPNQPSEEVVSLEKRILGLFVHIKTMKERSTEYSNRFNQIYSQTRQITEFDFSDKVKDLAKDIEESPVPNSAEMLNKLKQLSYPRLVRVPETKEKVVVKEGHYEEEVVEPEYEIKQEFSLNKQEVFGVPVHLTYGVLSMIVTGKDQGFFSDVKRDVTKYNKVIKTPGYTKKVWKEPIYADKTIPAHYKRVIFTPYYGSEKLIEEPVREELIKQYKKLKRSR